MCIRDRADDGDVGVGEDDRQRCAAAEAAQLGGHGVDSGDVAFVGGLVQQGRSPVGVTGQKDRQVGDLQGVGAVSYTHLDVYKRQPSASRSALTALLVTTRPAGNG